MIMPQQTSENEVAVSAGRGAPAEHFAPQVASPEKAIELMLDYAIMEAAELRLPVLVYLLRMAQLELSVVTGGTPGASAFR